MGEKEKISALSKNTKCDSMISFDNYKCNVCKFNDIEIKLKQNLKIISNLIIKFRNLEFRIGDIINIFDKELNENKKFKINFGLYFDGEKYIDEYHLGVYLENLNDKSKEREEITFPDFIKKLITNKFEIIQPDLDKLEDSKTINTKFAKLPDNVSYNNIIWKLEKITNMKQEMAIL